MGIMNIFDKTYDYAEKFISSQEFKELLAIKEEIQDKLSSLVQKFKEAQDKYKEAKENKVEPSELKKYQLEFVKAKETLFSEELVQKYRELEKTLQDNLTEVAKRITSSISARFLSPNVPKETEHDKTSSTDHPLPKSESTE